jgi:hypothetical protein
MNHLIHKWFCGPEQPSMPNCAPHDFAQHIAAAIIRWHNPVSNQKSGGSGMVGNNTERRGGM